jgi:hypothetical protein
MTILYTAVLSANISYGLNLYSSCREPVKMQIALTVASFHKMELRLYVSNVLMLRDYCSERREGVTGQSVPGLGRSSCYNASQPQFWSRNGIIFRFN